ncbi:uncharacterized protein K02A2.6-like [Pecten maximus]|uniref:uncharacterized protein K02A2.6-like n=1 Tax=Pecten maximus TaxID=6579 RepID=UPI001458C4DF|nr:uncharacterized protein K02A2.6-like [Pecten maximus]
MTDQAAAAVPQPAPQIIHVPTNIPFPPKLDLKGNICTNWKRFKRVWDNYEVASGLSNKENSMRTATFLTCIGPDALEIFEGFEFADDNESKNLDVVIGKFNTFCIGKTNEIYERYLFNRREQEQSENIDTYVSALRKLAKTCNYGTLEDNLIRDRIVIGVRDNTTRKKLLQESQLTLTKCIDLCRANEKTSMQLKDIAQEDIHYVKKQNERKPPANFRKGPDATPKHKELPECKYCDRRHVLKRELCPAWGEKCAKCGKFNHFSVKCSGSNNVGRNPVKHRNKKGKLLHHVDDYDESSDESEEYMFSVEEVNSCTTKSNRINAVMLIKNQTVEFQLDCGSSVNVLPAHIYRHVCRDRKLSKLNHTNKTLIMFNKTETKPEGKQSILLVNPKNNCKYVLEFVIVEGDFHPILGSQAIQTMNLITVNHGHIQRNISEVHDIKRSDIPDLTKSDLEKQYPDVFQGEGKFKGDKLHLQIDSSVPPVKLPVRKQPLALKERVKGELDRLVEKDIIIPVNEPTDWISSIVVVTKPSGKVRLCIDPQPLNKALKRNHYSMPTLDDILPDLTKARIFSVADAKNGFWHVELDDESSYLTTFGTIWGRYRWKRMPFGISPAPEEFQRRMDEVVEGLLGVKAIHDDILIFGCGDTDEEARIDHDRNLLALLQRCRERGVKLNKEKLKLKLDQVTYMGHVISSKGLHADSQKVQAIKEMPTPQNKADVQRLLGMVNFVQRFAPRISEITAPLRQLIKHENEFAWNCAHDKAFEELKTVLTDTPVLQYFDPSKPTVLQSDASQSGLGACLLQEGHPVGYASRALTPTEQNYAQIEKELLSVVFGLEKFETYTYGRKVLVESDHKPLEIICRKSLLNAPKRLQRMLLKLQKFDLEVVYKPGSTMYMADTLSRAYLPFNTRSSTEVETEHVNAMQYLPISPERCKALQLATEQDPALSLLKSVIRKGWPLEKTSVPKEVQAYFGFREELTIQNGLVFKGNRVVVPFSEVPSLVERAHSSHSGIQSCLRRARECLYWPNMAHDIEDFVSKCEICNAASVDQGREPIINHPIPSRPWEKVGCDLFEYDQRNYLITVDYYSDYFEVDRLHDKTAKEIIVKLKANFARHGIPDSVFSDNGPPFGSRDFQSFSKAYEFKHSTSSPGYPQSNGKVENAVKIAKRLIRKSKDDGTDPYLALLDWRNTPTEGVLTSPNQRIFGRRTKTLLPTPSTLLVPQTPQSKDVAIKLKQRKEKQAYYYNRGTKQLGDLMIGDCVRIRPHGHNKSWTKAVVQDQPNIRSFNVQTEDGRVYRRNRRHLRKTHEICNPFVPNDELASNPENLPTNDPKDCNNSQAVMDNPETLPSQPVQEEPVSAPPNATTNSPQIHRTRYGRAVKRPTYLDDYA